MTVVQAIVLGIVQGVTEFLPISSSGHLVLLQKVFGIHESNLLFITLLHLGTVAAVIFALQKEVRWLVRHPFSWTGRMIFVALIPTALVGAVFEEAFEHLFASGITVGFEFVITGALLWWMDSANYAGKSEEDMTAVDALWIGVAQGAAILPALSRSGLTIAAGLWRGMSREAAARYSFLLSIPAILGATAVELEDAVEDPVTFTHMAWLPMAAGLVCAIVAGYVAVKATLWLLGRSRMRIFAIYVWVIAGGIFVDQLWWHHFFPTLLG